MTDIAEFTAKPEVFSLEPGFDTVFVPNEDLTDTDETSVATYLQNKLDIHRQSLVVELFHNQTTAHRAIYEKSGVTAVRVPRHLNVRSGDVATQRETIEAHNRNPNTTYELVMADDITAMCHIAFLNHTKRINSTTPYNEDRFWDTYHRNVLGTALAGSVPNVGIYSDGLFFRNFSPVTYSQPTRALVVAKA